MNIKGQQHHLTLAKGHSDFKTEKQGKSDENMIKSCEVSELQKVGQDSMLVINLRL